MAGVLPERKFYLCGEKLGFNYNADSWVCHDNCAFVQCFMNYKHGQCDHSQCFKHGNMYKKEKEENKATKKAISHLEKDSSIFSQKRIKENEELTRSAGHPNSSVWNMVERALKDMEEK